MPRFLEYFGVPTQVENSAFIEAVKTGDLHKVDQDLRLKKGKSSAIIAKVNKLYRGKHEGVPSDSRTGIQVCGANSPGR